MVIHEVSSPIVVVIYRLEQHIRMLDDELSQPDELVSDVKLVCLKRFE